MSRYGHFRFGKEVHTWFGLVGGRLGVQRVFKNLDCKRKKTDSRRIIFKQCTDEGGSLSWYSMTSVDRSFLIDLQRPEGRPLYRLSRQGTGAYPDITV